MPLVRKPPASAAPTEATFDAGLLTSGTADQRWTAARTAATSSDGVGPLASALMQESDPRVREAIFTGLARIATPESAEALLPCLRSDDASLRTGAIDALKAMPAACRPHLASLLADPDPDVRILSCELARGLAGPEASRMLCALLDTEIEKNVCAAAVEVLAEVGTAEALPILDRCAERFAEDSFLVFSIKEAADRIGRP